MKIETAPTASVVDVDRAYVVFDPHGLIEHVPGDGVRLIAVADADDKRVETLARELADTIQAGRNRIERQADRIIELERENADLHEHVNRVAEERTLAHREIRFLYDELAKLARRAGIVPESDAQEAEARYKIKARLEALAARRNIEGRQYEGPNGGNW
jgi:chromosome segregation ATPase